MHTMFHLMDESEYSDITVKALDNDINENKGKHTDRKCVDRDFSKTTVLGQKPQSL